MKSKITATILTLLSLLPAFAEKLPQQLILETPEDWKVNFEGEKGIQFYTVTLKEDPSTILMLSRWPVRSTAQEIPELVNTLGEAFLDQAKENKDFELKTEKYKVKEIKGDNFFGNYVKFKIKGGIIQTMFMIGKEKDLWNGQFTGTEKQWTEALSIIKKIKKKG